MADLRDASADADSAARMHCFAHEAMRTRFELVIEDDIDPAAARAVAEEIFAEIDLIETLLSAWNPRADLYRINAAAATPVRVDPRVIDFLLCARTMVEETSGAFDPTVGAVMHLLRGQELTDQAALDSARGFVGFTRMVELDAAAGTVSLAHENARIDPGALGKGYALDVAARLLGDLEIENALLHAGTSSVVALGSPRGQSHEWRVGVASPPTHPAPAADGNIAVANLRDTSLSVSAPHGRLLTWPDGATGHIADPRSCGPALGARLAAVVADSGAIAEAWSTALICLGPAGLDDLARLHPAASALVVPADGAPTLLGTAFSLVRRE